MGFTLIELLIVVAIIAILAAIAIPNFLNAQVRSKVSRVLSDLRTMRTAAEAYSVDNTVSARMSWGCTFDDYYGQNPCEEIYGTLVGGPSKLCSGMDSPKGRGGGVTSPIVYITTLPTDPFAEGRQSNQDAILYTYQATDTFRAGLTSCPVAGMPGYVYAPSDTPELNRMEKAFGKYFLWSVGPLGQEGLSYPGMGGGCNFFIQYDPTNGTVSNGRIYVSQRLFTPRQARFPTGCFWTAWPGE